MPNHGTSDEKSRRAWRMLGTRPARSDRMPRNTLSDPPGIEPEDIGYGDRDGPESQGEYAGDGFGRTAGGEYGDEDRDPSYEAERLSPPPAMPRNDQTIANDITDQLTERIGIDAAEIVVRSDDGVVSLFGTVESMAVRNAAEEVALSTAGVRAIDNQIAVHEGATTERGNTMAPRVGDVMHRGAEVVRPDDTVKHAAVLIEAHEVGSLPVCDGERLVGILTDRDITVRTVAAGRDPSRTTVRDAMTADDLAYVYEDQDLEEAISLMSEREVRRLPVIDRSKRLVGILALADIARRADEDAQAEALQGVSEPTDTQDDTR